MGQIVQVKSMQDFKQHIEAAKDKLTVIDFWATWCGPCKMIAPIFEKLAEANPDVQFLKVDVDQVPDVAAANNISAMPTFHFYKNGMSIYSMRGANPQLLVNLVNTYKPK